MSSQISIWRSYNICCHLLRQTGYSKKNNIILRITKGIMLEDLTARAGMTYNYRLRKIKAYNNTDTLLKLDQLSIHTSNC
jgi:hypothetical protein